MAGRDVARGQRSRGMALRQGLDLYSCVRPCKTYPGVRSRYEGVVRKHIHPKWDRVKLANVSHGDVQAWVTELAELGSMTGDRLRLDRTTRAGEGLLTVGWGVSSGEIEPIVIGENSNIQDGVVIHLAAAHGQEYRETLDKARALIGALDDVRARGLRAVRVISATRADRWRSAVQQIDARVSDLGNLRRPGMLRGLAGVLTSRVFHGPTSQTGSTTLRSR